MQYMYTSLSEHQIKEEELIQKNPLLMGKKEVEENAAEILYRVSIN